MGRVIKKTADPKRNVPLTFGAPSRGTQGQRPVPSSGPAQKDDGPKVVVPHDPVSEAIVIAACAQDDAIRSKLTKLLFVDHFLAREHAQAWAALIEIERRKLVYDTHTASKIAGDDVARTLSRIVENAPNAAQMNLEFHIGNVKWDRALASTVQGPLQKFLEAIKDPSTERDAIRSLARSIAGSFEGYEDRQWVHDPETLVREQMVDIEARVDGRALYPYGIDGLDYYSDQTRDGEPVRRLIPGAAPKQITCVTAISGGGKSTFTAHIALGLARLGRSVLWGAWEMQGGMNLELLACISLGWSRQELTEGRGPISTLVGRLQFQERMHAISKHVKFLKNPFRRKTGEKRSNERNLDILHGILSDERPDVFIADLWKRCLAKADPEEEEDALIRQQMMAEDLNQHHILLQQQRLKDIESRPDKRPTREGIKGSGAWIEVPDTILGVHRPALWKKVDDDRLEVFVLKQRYGKWPEGVEFEWSAEHGSVHGGRSISYDRPNEMNEVDSFNAAGAFLAMKGKGKR